MWTSFKEYLKTVGYWWWVVVAGIILTATGAVLDSQTVDEGFVPFWGWVAIGLFGLFVAQFLAFQKVRGQREVLKQQIDGLLDTPMLDFSGINYVPLLNRTDSSRADFDISLLFDNIGSVRLRYEVQSLSIELTGKTANNPKFNNKGGVILPAKQSRFYYPLIPDVDLSESPITGRIEYTIEYVTIPDLRKFRQRRVIALTFYPPKELDGNWYSRYIFMDAPDDERVS